VAGPPAEPIDAGPRPARRDPEAACLLCAGLISVAVSVSVRVLERGPYVSGWSLVAPTQGHLLASTRPAWSAIREVFYQNRHFWLPFSVYSAPYSLIPGYLGRLWPWEYWVHVLVFVTFCGTLWTILEGAGLPFRAAGILLLGWGASPMLLSHAVEGYPWASAFLPHALALWITTSHSLRRRPLLTLLSALLVDELSWHVYELGRTVAVVFLAGTVLLRDVPRSTRTAWLVAALVQLGEVLFVHPTANINAFVYQRSSPWPAFHPGLGAVLAGVVAAAKAIATLELDLPVLLAVGVASFLFFRRDRRFLVALLLVKLGLVLLLATFQADQLRPRRFIMVEGYCLVAIAWMYREASALPRRLLAALLLLGNVWQGSELIGGFVPIPFAMGTSFTMPYTYSREGVGSVTFSHVDWAHALRREVEKVAASSSSIISTAIRRTSPIPRASSSASTCASATSASSTPCSSSARARAATAASPSTRWEISGASSTACIPAAPRRRRASSSTSRPCARARERSTPRSTGSSSSWVAASASGRPRPRPPWPYGS